ncbi:MAG: hypothetical protein QXU20_03285 [Candidatus Woesearchaeota archaeon]
MKNLMSSNLYEFKGKVVICGSCIPSINKKAFSKIKKISKNIFFVCLEEIHMNMVAHKIASILRTGNVKEMYFISVDKSPHCIQLHYVRNEIEKIMQNKNFVLKNYIIVNDNLEEINSEIISLSKNLSKLKRLCNK